MKKTNKIKVMTIFGTRPEIIKLSRVFAKLDEYVNHIMVHTGQSYDTEMNQIFFEELKIRKPDYFLGVKNDTLGGQIANILLKSEEVLKKELPDAVLILGDTNSALSSIIAKRMKIPIFHMEAGNRCFDENVPEELNRKIVDHVSDINLPYSEQARTNLLQEGIPAGTVFVTGSPQKEILTHHERDIAKSTVLKELKLSPRKYFVASLHREENVDDKESLTKLVAILNTLAEQYQLPVLVSAHPRTTKRLQEHVFKFHNLVKLHKPFGLFDYVMLEKNALCVISDSGTIQEESSILGFPAVQVRTSSERPEAFDEGTLILAGRDTDAVLQAIEVTVKQHQAGEKFNIPRVYQDANVSSKVLRLILGYSRIVKNKRVVRG
ncbi:UDP-N-acetylglucosamine 2-epimerase (non-hydrolyzing) [Candidatus Parcubacteria bacterium]|nr:UDP-N-acetylglucosamine 2-epimerase (non-hydrolyzing) [Candidatus Parcubacteria bacterium]